MVDPDVVVLNGLKPRSHIYQCLCSKVLIHVYHFKAHDLSGLNDVQKLRRSCTSLGHVVSGKLMVGNKIQRHGSQVTKT